MIGEINGSVLVIAAHPDDEVLGCGATLAKVADAGVPIDVVFLADGESSRDGATQKDINDRKDAASRAQELLGIRSIRFLDGLDNALDSVPRLEIIKGVEELVSDISPRHLLSHHRWDLNIDHQIAHEVAVTLARPKHYEISSLLFFETPSSTEWRPSNTVQQFSPSAFIDVSGFQKIKSRAMLCYERETREYPHPRSADGLDALLRVRGMQAGVEFAEAFEIGRLVLT